MLRLWQSGHQVVFGVRITLPDPPLVAAARRLFYRVAHWLSEEDLPLDAGEFRLVDACVLRELRRVRDVRPYVRGLISTMGFSQIAFPYERAARTAGVSKFPFWKMVELGLDGILNHSLVPLRLASLIGMLVGLGTMILIFAYLAGRLLFGQTWPAGFATTTILLLLGITLNAFFLGIIGEYLGRIFLHMKRPIRLAVESEIGPEQRREAPRSRGDIQAGDGSATEPPSGRVRAA
jgi:dolichol-phosphate mannosyltransferase